MKKVKILFVCLGNICRSPMAEGIFKHLIDEKGYAENVGVDSAGTIAFHAGENADRRMLQKAKEKGIVLDSISRQFQSEDFQNFDYIIPMDASNLEDIKEEQKTQGENEANVLLMREFDEEATGNLNVPDPYYLDADGFEEVYHILNRSCRKLLERILAENNL